MKYQKKIRTGIKLRKNNKSDKEENKPLNKTYKMLKKRKAKAARKKDEENILSKDIDVEEEMKELERLGERKNVKTRDAYMDYTKSSIKNLKFKPQKYKGSFLPYHQRWIFNNSVKSNEIVLLQEIEALEVRKNIFITYRMK
jgi:hypothetical protein